MKMEVIGKEYLITEYKLKLTSDEAANEKKILGAYVKHVIKTGETISELYAREFYETILPEEPGTYWLFARREKSYVNKVFKSKEEYISALLKLSACTDLNLFYSLANYYGKHENASVRFLKCLAIDIDDLTFDPMEKKDEELLDFVQTTYHLENKPMFNVFTVSGHGLHMYWFLNEEIARFPFEEYQNHLTTYFHSDRACIPSSHFWRCPGSHNCKAEPIKTRIIPLDPSPITLEEMDVYKMTAEEIEEYRQKCNAERTAKSNATRLKNGTCAKAIKTSQRNQQSQSKPKAKGSKTATAKKEKVQKIKVTVAKTDESVLVDTESLPALELITDFRKGEQNLNLVKNLHNLYVKRLEKYGDPQTGFKGRRNFFIFIMTNYLKNEKSLQECIDWCCRYFGPEFRKETIATVKKNYAYKKMYCFQYDTILQLFNITAEEYKDFTYFYFSKDQKRIAYNKKQNAIYHRKHNDIQICRKEIRNYIKNNMSTGAKELAEVLSISPRTVYRIKKELRTD